jgi:putative membrane protein
MRAFLSILGAASAAVWPMAGMASAADAASLPCYAWGPQMMWGAGWSGMIFGPLIMLVLLGAAVFVLVRAVGGFSQGGARPPDRAPIDILKERFARGEIDQEEFDARRRALGD